MRPTIVKIGGSFAHFRRLRDVVAALEKGRGKAVVVPGGGPFADRVRKEQRRIGFDDAAAHRMALLAMAEFGYALSSLGRSLVPAESLAVIRKVLRGGGVPVWLPFELLAGDAAVPETWDMTSDSLAVWLAGRLDAQRIILIKRGAAKAPTRLADLVEAEILDPLVPELLAATRAEAWLCGPRDIGALGKALKTGAAAGRRIVLD